jgi:uroporphyrin-III C-methyltransferase
MGRVAFVGAGPGAADLITLRGARLLAQAEVVFADALADPALRELAPQAAWTDVGKRGFEHATRQHTIDAMLVDAARRHTLVVRLKGGDPSIFGRLEEELLALAAHGIDCEVVPGVTAAGAAAAQMQRPLTRRGRGRSVAFGTAMTASGEAPAARRADSEVFYMAGRQLATLGQRLQAAGWPADTPASVVSRAGCSDARATDHRLDALAQAVTAHAGRPTVVVVGVAASPLPVAGMTAARAGAPPSAFDRPH